jgi:hypothetical protein
MKIRGGYNINLGIGIFLAVSIVFLAAGSVTTFPVDHIAGAQEGTPDEQSTTGPTPPGGPNGAAASAGEGYTPGPISKIIENVPPYIWRDGCGPTTAAMILGYWDWYYGLYGFDWIIPGDAHAQTQAVNDVIASPQHEVDYAIPHDVYPDLRLDKSEPGNNPHASNSLADFMSTSFSARDNYFGWSWFSDVPLAFEGYLASVNPGNFTVKSYNVRWGDGTLTWDIYKSFIDKNIPVMLLVDSTADGQTDHFIPAIGFDDSGKIPMYAAYNTWDGAVHWYRWGPMIKGTPYGIFGGTILYIDRIFPTATPTGSATVTFTPSLTYTPTGTLLPTFTPTITNTWTSTWTSIPTASSTSTPVPEIPPKKADISGLLIGLLIYALISTGGLIFAFVKLTKEQRIIDKEKESDK